VSTGTPFFLPLASLLQYALDVWSTQALLEGTSLFGNVCLSSTETDKTNPLPPQGWPTQSTVKCYQVTVNVDEWTFRVHLP
jgi:hypothetical protein